MLRKIKLILGTTIVGMAAACIYVSLNIIERQNAAGEISRYNTAWAASQALSELQRFETSVAAYTLDLPSADADDVLLRLDILHNRLTTLRGKEFAGFLSIAPGHHRVLDALGALLADVEPLVAVIDEPGIAEQVFSRAASLEKELARFAAAVNQFSGQQTVEDQKYLLHLHWAFLVLAGGMAACTAALVLLLFLQSKAVGRAHSELGKMADHLRRAKNEAEAASEAKSRFLASMSHELRTPLNAIVGFSEFVLDEPHGPVGHERYREYVDNILKSGRHMTTVVSDILTMAKMDAGRMSVTLTEIQPRFIADSAIRMVLGTEMALDREIAIAPEGDWPTLLADEGALRQILLNLLSNALKFSPPDGPVRISAEVTADGDYCLSVSDEGIGMTAKEAEMAAQPFVQIDNSLSRKYQGSGLGLSIVKGLMEMHGGRLLIESAPDKGSRISVLFPAQLIVRAPSCEPPIAARRTFAQPKLLSS